MSPHPRLGAKAHHGAALLGAAWIGCAASHSIDGPIDADLALYEEVFARRCERAIACERGDWYGAARLTEDACNPEVLAAATMAIRAGEVHLDTENARACLEGLDAVACPVARTFHASGLRHPASTRALDELVVACAGVVVTNPIACAGDFCEAEERCVADGSGRHCVRVPTLGEPCNRRLGCRGGERCLAPLDGEGLCAADCVYAGIATCIEHGLGYQCTGVHVECAPAPTVGEPCAALSDGTLVCEIEAVCDAATGLCRTPGRVGEPCDPTLSPSVCDFRLQCDGALGTCQSDRVLPCHLGDGHCDPDEYCHADGTCSMEPEGGECTSVYWSTDGAVFAWLDSCPEGYACDGRASDRDGPWARCHAVVPAAGACTAMSACVEGTACRDGHCAPVIAPFGPCTVATDCRTGWTCRDGQCVAPPR